jgi:hypothetical protein
VPAAAAVYDALRPRRPRTRYNLEQLGAHLQGAVEEARPFAQRSMAGKNLVLFAPLHYWIEQAAIVGLALRGMGHRVTIAYLPYSNWEHEINEFDLQRQDLYTRRVLARVKGLLDVISLRDFACGTLRVLGLSDVSQYDVMYSSGGGCGCERRYFDCVWIETALPVGPCWRTFMQIFLTALVPNGLVTELGIFYRVRALKCRR